ncbi:MAG: PAS domain S-box protein, partial [Smithella sp.]
MNDTCLYNSIIIKNYLEYLEKKYPDLEVKPLLDYARIANHEVEDRGHWFTQKQVNRFHEYLDRVTANPDIAREAGRHVASPTSSNILRRITVGFLTPAFAYWAVEKLASTISRHQTTVINKLSDDSIEFISLPKKNVKEELFQCQNRIGMLEAIAEIFTHKYANIDHTECIHRGDGCCKYIVTWDKPPFLLWERTGNYLLASSLIVNLICSFLLPVTHWLILLLFSLLVSGGTLLYGSILHRKELSVYLNSQGKAYDQVIEQTNLRYNESLLIREIGEAASRILEPQQLLDFIRDALQKRLQFNRGMIMLANPEKTKLVYTTGYGFTEKEEELLKNTEFNLTNPQSTGIFNLAFRNQEPFLINKIDDIINQHSAKTVNFMKELAIKAFICVPIIYERHAEGILAVDGIKSKSPLTQSNLSLLMGIAPQIGISLNNAMAHKKLKESEERFRNLSNNSPDIIYQLDLEGKFKYINPAWEKVFGHERNKLWGKSIIDFMREENRVGFAQICQEIISDKATVRDKNFIFLNKNGLSRHVNFTGAPDLDAEGRVTGIVGTLKDITRLRNMEAQLLQASKMEAVGTLTGGIAHDFNNIIQAIMGYNQLMIARKIGNENEKDMTYLNNIEELLQRSQKLVQQLMLFSKKVDPQAKVININNEIMITLSLLIKSIPKMIAINNNLAENIFSIKADSTQIGQIIMNLVINARDAIGDSGNITITTKNVFLADDAFDNGLSIPAGNYVEISVSDTGSGMETEVMQHIFEPFFTTKEVGRGTGLGLAVVYGIVKSHNGLIYCESELGKGTKFTILFPALPTAMSKDVIKSRQPANQLPSGTETILLVDDEKNILETVRDMLTSYGYTILT